MSGPKRTSIEGATEGIEVLAQALCAYRTSGPASPLHVHGTPAPSGSPTRYGVQADTELHRVAPSTSSKRCSSASRSLCPGDGSARFSSSVGPKSSSTFGLDRDTHRPRSFLARASTSVCDAVSPPLSGTVHSGIAASSFRSFRSASPADGEHCGDLRRKGRPRSLPAGRSGHRGFALLPMLDRLGKQAVASRSLIGWVRKCASSVSSVSPRYLGFRCFNAIACS